MPHGGVRDPTEVRDGSTDEDPKSGRYGSTEGAEGESERCREVREVLVWFVR